MKFQLNYFCISIVSTCNYECKYCYRVSSKCKLMKKEPFERLMVRLSEMGTKVINITGGEPFLHPDLEYFVNCASSYGFYIILSTNGSLLDLHADILKKVNLVVTSLDGSNEYINALTRAPFSFAKIKEIIDEYTGFQFPFQLKINTVVTRFNFDDLLKTAELLQKKNIYWRLFYCKQGGEYNRISCDDLVTKEMFKARVAELKELFDARFLSGISEYDIDEELSYSIINPDYDLFISCGGTTIKIGNILSSPFPDLRKKINELGEMQVSYKGKSDY